MAIGATPLSVRIGFVSSFCRNNGMSCCGAWSNISRSLGIFFTPYFLHNRDLSRAIWSLSRGVVRIVWISSLKYGWVSIKWCDMRHFKNMLDITSRMMGKYDNNSIEHNKLTHE